MTIDQVNRSQRVQSGQNKLDPGVYVAVVMENKDATFNGRLAVWISDHGSKITDKQSWITVGYANPFYGITATSGYNNMMNQSSNNSAGGQASNQDAVSTPQAKQGDQNVIRSYGMWTQPPEIGSRVLVLFAAGNVNEGGYWIASIPEVSHAMIPAIGTGPEKKPQAEFDPYATVAQTTADLRTIERPVLDDEVKKFEAQGLQDDTLRGFITSSSLRESPSKVMGFSTPAGHTFVMDDGDENGKSKLVRLRTSSGNQITMHDDTGMIYVINAQGTGWLELSPSGHLDVYAEAGINLSTKKDINLHADNDVNIHAGNNLKMVAMKGAKLQGTEELQMHGKKTMLEGVDQLHIHSCTEIIITSFKNMYLKAFEYFVLQGKCFKWNSGTAKEAEQVPPERPQQVSGYMTTVARAPSHEPYKEHDGGQPQPSSGTQNGAQQGVANLMSGQPISGAQAGSQQGVANLMSGQPITSTQRGSEQGVANLVAGQPISGTTGGLNLENAVTTYTGGPLAGAPIASGFGTPSAGTFLGGPLAGGAIDTAFGAKSPQQAASQSLNGAIGQIAPISNIPAQAGGGSTGFAKGNNCNRPSAYSGQGPANPNAPGADDRMLPGKQLTPEEEAAAVAKIKADAAAKGITLSDEDIANLKGVYAGEGYGGVVTAMNRAQAQGTSVSQAIANGGYVGWRGPSTAPMSQGFVNEFGDWSGGRFPSNAYYILSPGYVGGTPYNSSGGLNSGFNQVLVGGRGVNDIYTGPL